MPKGKRYTPEQIITKLREAEVLQSQGMSHAVGTKAVTTGFFMPDRSLLPEQRPLCCRVKELHIAGVEVKNGVFTNF